MEDIYIRVLVNLYRVLRYVRVYGVYRYVRVYIYIYKCVCVCVCVRVGGGGHPFSEDVPLVEFLYTCTYSHARRELP